MLNELIVDLVGSFAIGLATPLTAVCVIPLYPGFIAYLSNRPEGRLSVKSLGFLVASGVITFMLLFGLLFTTVLEISLTHAIEVVSPIAFALLGLLSIALLADLDIARFTPSVSAPTSQRPVLTAFGYGFFFGGIVIPCNPGLIALFFARSLLFADPIMNVANFLAFGLGIGSPLIVLAVVSDRWSSRVIGLLTRHQSVINRGTGVVMLAIALYYLVIVFDLFNIAHSLPAI